MSAPQSSEPAVKSVLNLGFFDDVVQPAMQGPAPQQAYSDFARKCPVAHNPDGSMTLTRYDDIRFFAQHRGVLGYGAAGAKPETFRRQIPLDLDGPEHRMWRRRLNPLFAAKKVAVLEPVIRERARQLLAQFVSAGEGDVVEQYCAPLPASMFLGLLGLPVEDLPKFRAFVNSQLHPAEGLTPEESKQKMAEGAEQLRQYLDDAIAARSNSDESDDILSWLLSFRDDDGSPINYDDLHSILHLLVIAGLDTTAGMLGNTLAVLAVRPDLRRQLVSDPTLWPNAIEEFMRYDTSVPLALRTATEEVSLPSSGQTIPAGTLVNLSWSSANLDEDIFDNPLEIDLHREPNPHFTFASGPHRCLGSHLARLQLRIAFEEFHKVIPDYELQPGSADLVYSHFPRAPKSLPLRWPSVSGDVDAARSPQSVVAH